MITEMSISKQTNTDDHESMTNDHKEETNA